MILVNVPLNILNMIVPMNKYKTHTHLSKKIIGRISPNPTVAIVATEKYIAHI